MKTERRGTGFLRQGYKVTCGKDAYIFIMACFELYQLFGTIITWLLISRSGYRRANLLSDPHNVLAAPCARRALVDETIRRGISLVVRIQRIQLSVAVTAAADIFISLPVKLD